VEVFEKSLPFAFAPFMGKGKDQRKGETKGLFPLSLGVILPTEGLSCILGESFLLTNVFISLSMFWNICVPES
jgi:hypothetical protein